MRSVSGRLGGSRGCATTHDHVAFRVLCAQDAPDHTTIARFRAAHEDAFAELFAQVLVLCAQAGMGKVGSIAIDGTKIAANASLGANRTEEALRRQARQVLTEADQVDATEDAEHGDARGDELPEEFADPTGRRQRIRAALEEIERQHRKAAEDDEADRVQAEEYLRRVETGETLPRGRPPAGVDPERLQRARLKAAEARWHQSAPGSRERAEAGRLRKQAGRALEEVLASQEGSGSREGAAARHRRRRGTATPQANTTDPDSRKMSCKTGGFLQGYNTQIAVSDDHLILAATVSQDGNDNSSFEPMVSAATTAAEAAGFGQVAMVLADAGYFSEHNLTLPGPDRLIAPGKHRDVMRAVRDDPADRPPPPEATARQQMAHRLRDPDQYERYKRRSATVETVIAHLKDQIGLRRFNRRGRQAATSELQLAAAVLNIRRLHGHLGVQGA